MYSAVNTLAKPGEPFAADGRTAPKPLFAQAEKPQTSTPAPATGPRTPQGKAISARNATTHGLFARDIVLPSLGEDPQGYQQLADEFTAQLAPRNLLERHYVEKIAAASWRLRRLHRWQAQLFEDDTLTEDERLDKLDKVLRHETALHRQIDTAVKMLGKDVPHLAETRARHQALFDLKQTEVDCRENSENELEVIFEAREILKDITADPELDYTRLDTAPVLATEKCENEPPPFPTLLPFPNREGTAIPMAGLGSEGLGSEGLGSAQFGIWVGHQNRG